jgi:hypothetical protein
MTLATASNMFLYWILIGVVHDNHFQKRADGKVSSVAGFGLYFIVD